MESKTNKLLKQVVNDPAANVNQLNTLIPALIAAFSEAPQQVAEAVGQIVKAMIKGIIIEKEDVERLIMGEELSKEAKEAKKFVITRFKVMMENLVDQVTDEDKFDFLSKVLLELSELVFEGVAPQDLLKRLVSSKGTHLLGKLLVKSMKDIGTLQLHYKQLTTQFMDLTLIALMSLNHAMTENDSDFKRKTLYSILTDFGVFDNQKKVQTAIIQIEDAPKEDLEEVKEGEDEEDSEIVKLIKKETKRQYENAFITFLSRVTVKQADLVKKVMLEMPKKVIFNFENPLLLSDFLTFYLNQDDDIELQVLSLRAIFILLEKHGLDYPNYYKKLYHMIKPKIFSKNGRVEVQSIFNMQEKSRFLRLLDLSLRSPVLPTQLIASFLKRLSRTIATQGGCFTSQDIMFVISFTTNLIKRHQKCFRLLHRRSALTMTLESDPYKADEADPLQTNALKSSLWELDTVMRQHVDSNIRQYAKVFKTDFLRKSALFKCEEFTQADPLAVLLQELEDVNNEKEGDALKKHLMAKHGQGVVIIGKKRSADALGDEGFAADQEYNDMMDQASAPKRAKFSEAFEDINDMFALHH